MRRKARLALDSTGPYGTLRGAPGKAYADDGTALYYEIDDIEPEGGTVPRRRRLFGRKAPAPVTVVFSHGYCLNQDSWHFQRGRAARRRPHRALGPAQPRPLRTRHGPGRGHARHHRPARPRSQGVIDAAAPEGPLVLVGHSMGGMTVMALADQYPELIRDRVVGVALVGTSSGRLGEVNFGLPVAASTR